jgi:hypothetical protein
MLRCLLFNVTKDVWVGRSLGIYRIAHVLRSNGIDTEVIDWANHWSLQQLQTLFDNRDPSSLSFVGFGQLFSLWDPKLDQFCDYIKKRRPDLPIISGSQTRPMFDSEYIDYFVQGWGEQGLLALLRWLFSNGTRPRFILNNNRGKKIITANDDYPAFPDRSLMVKYQDRDFLQPNEWLGIEMGRGCQFQCAFCNFPALGVKEDYSRDGEDFRSQLQETYDRFGVHQYWLADDTVNDRTEKLTKFANEIEKLSFKPTFIGYIRADLLIRRPRDREELLRMNLIGHYYGIESFQKKANSSVGKGMKTAEIQQGLIDIKNYFGSHQSKNYRGTISLIVGLPGDTHEDLENTKTWLIENWQNNSFVIQALMIFRGDWSKQSKMTFDFQKLGYEQIEPTSDKIKNPYLRDWAWDYILWKNPQMNFYQAEEIVDGFVSTKYHYDFRPDIWKLTARMQGVDDIQQRLALTYDTMECAYIGIEDYIESKLSIGPT